MADADAPYQQFNDDASSVLNNNSIIPPHPGWKHYFDQQGRCYYVEDGTGTTQWTHPVHPTFFYAPPTPRSQQPPQPSQPQPYYTSSNAGPQADGPLLQQETAHPVNPNPQYQQQPPAPTQETSKIGTLDPSSAQSLFSKYGGYAQYMEQSTVEIPNYVERLKAIPHNNLDIEKVTKQHSLRETICDKAFSTLIRLLCWSGGYWLCIFLTFVGIVSFIIDKKTDLTIACFALGISFWFMLVLLAALFFLIARKLDAMRKATEFQLMNMMTGWKPASKATVFDRIQRYQLSQPTLFINSECFHYKTVTETSTVYETVYRGGQYVQQSRLVTQQVVKKVVTHTNSYNVPVTAYVDTSPRNVLDACDRVSNVITSVTYHESFYLLPEQEHLVSALEFEVFHQHNKCDAHCSVTHTYRGLDDSDDKPIDTILNAPDSTSYKLARVLCFNPFAFVINLVFLGCWFPAGVVYKSLACYIEFHSTKTLYLGRPSWFKESKGWSTGDLDQSTKKSTLSTPQFVQPPQPMPDIVTTESQQYSVHNMEPNAYPPLNDTDFAAYQNNDDSNNVYHQYS